MALKMSCRLVFMVILIFKIIETVELMGTSLNTNKRSFKEEEEELDSWFTVINNTNNLLDVISNINKKSSIFIKSSHYNPKQKQSHIVLEFYGKKNEIHSLLKSTGLKMKLTFSDSDDNINIKEFLNTHPHSLVLEKNYETFKSGGGKKITKNKKYYQPNFFPSVPKNNSINKNSGTFCRFALGSGKLGYHSGSFSWGVDYLDQRTGPMDGVYCPFGGNSQGTGVNVYVLDTGIGTHTSINFSRIFRDFDYYYNQNLYGSRPICDDLDGHGSHVIGLIVSSIYGVAPEVNLHVYKVLDDQGYGSFASLAAGLADIYNKNVTNGIISMSLGTLSATSSFIKSYIDEFINNRGFIVVAAAGNDNTDACNNFPSNIEGMVSVGAIDITFQKAYYSNYGSCVTLFAPGTNVISCGKSGSNAQILSGTSMSTPIVSGVFALYRQQYPTETNKNIINMVLNAGTKGILKSIGVNSPNILIFGGIPGSQGGGGGGGGGGGSGSSSPPPFSSSTSTITPTLRTNLEKIILIVSFYICTYLLIFL